MKSIMNPPLFSQAHAEFAKKKKPKLKSKQHVSTWAQAGLGLGVGVTAGATDNGHCDKSRLDTEPPALVQSQGELACNTRPSSWQHAKTAGPMQGSDGGIGSGIGAGPATGSSENGHCDKSWLKTEPPAVVQAHTELDWKTRPSASQHVRTWRPIQGSAWRLTSLEAVRRCVARTDSANRARAVTKMAAVFIFSQL